jgi:hypothetical protein
MLARVANGDWQSNPSLVKFYGVRLSDDMPVTMPNSQVLASWRRQRAWMSAALLFAADAKLSANPLRTSLWDLHPLICEFAGKHSNIVIFLCSVCLIQCPGSGCKLKHYPFASGGSANTSGFIWREFAHRLPTLQRSVDIPREPLADSSEPKFHIIVT